MKNRLLPIAVALLMIMSSVNLFSQGDMDNPLVPGAARPSIFLGPVAGYNNVSHSADNLATFAHDKNCPDFTGGTGQGFYVGLSYEHHFGKFEESYSSIIARVLFSMYPGSMDREGDQYPTLVYDRIQPSNYKIIRSSTKHTLDISYNVISLEVMYKQNFMKDIPLGVTAGPTFEFPITKQVTQKYMITEPDNVQFLYVDTYKYEDGNRTVIVKDGDIDNATSLRLGIKFGLQYEIIPGPGFYVVPGLWYNFSILKVKSDEDYRINAFQVGADIRFAL